MPPRQRDIWLVPIPFSDLRSHKRRPVVVISNDRYHEMQEDCLVMAITSRIEPDRPYGLIFTAADLEEGALPKPSQIRADKVFSIHQRIMIRHYGRLNQTKYGELMGLLDRLIKEGPVTSSPAPYPSG